MDCSRRPKLKRERQQLRCWYNRVFAGVRSSFLPPFTYERIDSAELKNTTGFRANLFA